MSRIPIIFNIRFLKTLPPMGWVLSLTLGLVLGVGLTYFLKYKVIPEVFLDYIFLDYITPTILGMGGFSLGVNYFTPEERGKE